MIDYALARRNMINGQLRPNNVTDDRVLAAIGAVPRELFVPSARRPIAYIDEDIDIGQGRWLIEPMVFARMLVAAQIEADDIVLDIACGTGYSTAVLAKLCNTVVAVEDVAALAEQANDTMTELAIGNAVVITGPVKAGCPSEAPYDVILINGAVEEIPAAIVDQLADGGRLVAVERQGEAPGRLVLLLKTDGAISRTELYGASTPLLDGFKRAAGFVF